MTYDLEGIANFVMGAMQWLKLSIYQCRTNFRRDATKCRINATKYRINAKKKNGMLLCLGSLGINLL